ncbi:MAG: helix-turn-helix transcriptional regulator [Bacteroidales bacterium]|jgi:transcriptional regulator with XRE-family HTH domain|nr:helix-turn-helix transcriptional regulator [Bacteroidales bacterium]HOL98571.1 helix-turn-helix transcriptional regulator [Bacteroidales bacterium]HOM36344.1 helix-turn-helix transcriptional regulator [Bacteroidales bacterium]HPD25041.1 helix-turn-helix transcriptional regulator [Bacteroidales bacterium]HRS99459.1 helix-turn-helix transcriptional regulator [Bacteroidales bacterium]
MTKETFRGYSKRLIKHRNLTHRKVVAQLDLDTSSFSKVEHGERLMSNDYLKILSQILKNGSQKLQVRLLTESINVTYCNLEYLENIMDEVIN